MSPEKDSIMNLELASEILKNFDLDYWRTGVFIAGDPVSDYAGYLEIQRRIIREEYAERLLKGEIELRDICRTEPDESINPFANLPVVPIQIRTNQLIPIIPKGNPSVLL